MFEAMIYIGLNTYTQTQRESPQTSQLQMWVDAGASGWCSDTAGDVIFQNGEPLFGQFQTKLI